jgi:hypothetical protein
MVFGVDDIHEIRLKMAEHYAQMTNEEVFKELQETSDRIWAEFEKKRQECLPNINEQEVI